MDEQKLWAVLVPCEMKDQQTGKLRPIRVRQHRVWDAKVRSITGGLTIMQPARGQWVSPTGELFAERMIPVHIACTREQLDEVLDYSLQFYNQEAMFAYLISEVAIIKHRKAEHEIPKRRNRRQDS